MKTCICVIIKDEQEYLEEWITHHLNLGIDEIFLYEDNDSISHADIIKPFGDKVHLELIDVIFKDEKEKLQIKNKFGSVNQDALFNWFPKTYKDTFDWILFNDIDEFLILTKPLHEFLAEYDDKPAIWLKWRFYGANGHIKKPQGKVMDNYTTYSPTSFDYGWTHKSFLNCKKYTYWEKPIHQIKGGVFPINEYGSHKAWLNHYFTKSWEEWKKRILVRGDTFPGHRKIHQFFKLNSNILHIKNDLMLEIAIDNATKLGFNQHINNNNLSKKYFHFCWFGYNNFSDLHLKCIESWKKYLSDDYVVCLWNENCFDFNSIEFTKDAYNHKKWAYVSDYVRLWCIYNFGGVYFDTDVELLKPIDNLPSNFLGIQKDYEPLATGLGFGAEKNNKIIGDMLNEYNNIIFEKDNKYNLTNTSLTTKYFIEKGYVIKNDEIHEFLGFTIYPDYYFCPMSNITKDINIREETISIHHYNLSWIDK